MDISTVGKPTSNWEPPYVADDNVMVPCGVGLGRNQGGKPNGRHNYDVGIFV